MINLLKTHFQQRMLIRVNGPDTLKYDQGQGLNVMTREWCVESGRFYMYQYMTRG